MESTPELDETPLLTQRPKPAAAGPGCGFWRSCANLLNAATGAGLLGMPYAYRALGLGLGLACTAGVASLSVLTLWTLVEAGSRYGARTYQELVRAAFGEGYARGLSAALIVYCFGSCCAYLIIVGDTMPHLMQSWLGHGSLFATRDAAIVLAATAMCLPLSLLRKLEALGTASVAGVVVLMYITLVVVAHGAGKLASDGRPAPGVVAAEVNFDSVLAVPILVFAFQCHIQVLQIMDELRDPAPPVRRSLAALLEEADSEDESDLADVRSMLSSGPEGGQGRAGEGRLTPGGSYSGSEGSQTGGQRRQACFRPWKQLSREKRLSMRLVVVVSVLACAGWYTCVGSFGYLYFGRQTEADVLSCPWRASDASIAAARGGMALIAVVSYPMNHHPSRCALDDLLCAGLGWTPAGPGEAPLARHVLQTLVFWAGTVGVALIVDSLGVMFSVIGATVGVTVTILVPALLIMRSRPITGSFARTVGSYSLLALGFAVMISSLVVTFAVKGPKDPPPSPSPLLA